MMIARITLVNGILLFTKDLPGGRGVENHNVFFDEAKDMCRSIYYRGDIGKKQLRQGDVRY